MSKLPDTFADNLPKDPLYFFGRPLSDYDRDDLEKIIRWQAEQRRKIEKRLTRAAWEIGNLGVTS